MAEIFVWRKSIQKKKGCCPVCGVKVLENGYPTDNVGIDHKEIDKKEKILWCANCIARKKGTILGTVKEVSQNVLDASRMYEGVDYDKLEKLLNKDMKHMETEQKTVKELKELVRRLEFENSMLKGNMESLKRKHEKEVSIMQDKNDSLFKKYKQLEEQYKLLGGV